MFLGNEYEDRVSSDKIFQIFLNSSRIREAFIAQHITVTPKRLIDEYTHDRKSFI